VLQIITYRNWQVKKSCSQTKRTHQVIECIKKPTCHGSQVVTLNLREEVHLVLTYIHHNQEDLIQVQSLALELKEDLTSQCNNQSLHSKCPINIKQLHQVSWPIIQKITTSIELALVLEPKVTLPIRRKTNRFQVLSIITTRRMLWVIWAWRITRKLHMDSLTSMINGKRHAIKEWNSTLLWERQKALVLTLNRILFIYRLQRELQNSQCPKVTEDFCHLNLKDHQALASIPMAHSRLELVSKINRLQCLKPVVMFHFQNMEPSIQSLSRKAYSERLIKTEIYD